MSSASAPVPEALDQAFDLFPRLGERRTQQAGTLSGGEQRMLSLARVLVTPPRLLIADELSLGLAPIVVDEVYRTLGSVRAAGASVLLIEQYVHHALAPRRPRRAARQGPGGVRRARATSSATAPSR